jgi:hypothetical protein
MDGRSKTYGEALCYRYRGVGRLAWGGGIIMGAFLCLPIFVPGQFLATVSDDATHRRRQHVHLMLVLLPIHLDSHRPLLQPVQVKETASRPTPSIIRQQCSAGVPPASSTQEAKTNDGVPPDSSSSIHGLFSLSYFI